MLKNLEALIEISNFLYFNPEYCDKLTIHQTLHSDKPPGLWLVGGATSVVKFVSKRYKKHENFRYKWKRQKERYHEMGITIDEKIISTSRLLLLRHHLSNRKTIARCT